MKSHKEIDLENQSTELAQMPQEDVMLTMIDKVCSDPNFDIAKMERLIDMRNSELARIAAIDFNRAFADMQSTLPRVVVKHKNTQTNSTYAKIEDINEVILPILNQHGFSVSFKIKSQDKEGVTVGAILAHSGGHKESTDLFMPYDKVGIKGTINKTDIHATGSTITYAKRYAICMLLDISTGDDNDGNNTRPSNLITPEQQKEITELLEASGIDKVKFIRDYLKVDAINLLPASNYTKALNALNTRINENANS